MMRRSTSVLLSRMAKSVLKAGPARAAPSAPRSLLTSAKYFSSVPTPGPPKEQKEAAAPKEAEEAAAPKASSSSSMAKVDYDDFDDYEFEQMSNKDKAKIVVSNILWLAALGFGAYCAYLTGKELFPGRLNPNHLFSEAFDFLRYNNEVVNIVGNDPKGFGRDGGRNTEGRRNHIDSFAYKHEDGSDRVRIRFNVKGKRGQLRCWAEVSSKMADNEYVYVICQNVKSGRVLTVEDNRERLDKEFQDMITSGDAPGSSVFSNIFNAK